MLRLLFLPIALTGLLLSSTAQAGCLVTTTGARCVMAPGHEVPDVEDQERSGISARFVSAPERLPGAHRGRHMQRAVSSVPRFAEGDILPDDVMILMNRDRFGLPEPRDGWTYFRDDYDIYRADLHSRVVIDRMNDHMTIRF